MPQLLQTRADFDDASSVSATFISLEKTACLRHPVLSLFELQPSLWCLTSEM